MEYLTIKDDIVDEIEIKKSRFITHLIKINSEEMAQEKLLAIKKEHRKANHSCSAYILGEDSSIKRMSDDGEPAGTAGVPMLSVLEENKLTNVLVVVTRYFGGIKLGKGGLIRAYSNSVSNLITNDIIAKATLLQKIQLAVPYHLFDSLKYELDQISLTTSNVNYADNITIDLYLPQTELKSLRQLLLNRFNGAISLTELETVMKEIPLKKD